MNGNGIQQAANPLPFLLAEEAHGDHQATDAVFLTFNADPGFFEARILGACLTAGARVCLLADGPVWNPDPYATKHAGREYHIGLVTRSGAFHPKLVLLVGPKRALVAVGSGNVTMGGWQHNAETWTILRGDLTEAPAVMAEVADVLDEIAGEGVDSLAAESLTRASGQLRAFLGGCAKRVDSGHRILSSTSGAIVGQLPSTKADDLRIYAPFHDESARGVAALVDSLRPRRVTVMVQPGWTVLNPSALERVLRDAQVDWTIVEDAEMRGLVRPRYRHGKLIEWTTSGGQTFALTGSPNLSYAALCAPRGSGNTEIAILSPVAESLFPPSAPVGLADVPRVRIPSPEAQGASNRASGPILLSAVVGDEHLALTLNRPLSSAGVLELSLRGESPDVWSTLAEVPADSLTPVVILPDPVPANSRVRLRTTGVDGTDSPGALVFVTNAASARRRHVMTIRSRTADITPADLLGSDLAIIDALARDLADLAGDLAASKPPPAASNPDGTPGQPESSKDTDASDWLWCQDQATAHHGRHLAAFGLGMPVPPSVLDSERLAWEDTLVEDGEAGLPDDTAEAVDADPDVGEVARVEPPDHTGDHAALRGARRRRIAKWAGWINAVPVASSLIVLRLTLVWWSAGDWEADDPEPHRVVATMLRALAGRDTRHVKELEERVASLGVVALTMMRDRVDASRHDENSMRFVQLRDDLSYWVLDARADLIEEYSALLRRPSGMPLDPQQVVGNIEEWLKEDPYSDVVSALESDGHSVARPGRGLLLVSGTFSDPDRVARSAASLVPEDSLPVGVWAVSETGRGWAFVMWDRPNLVKAINAGSGPTRWRQQHLGPLLGPLTSIQDGSHVGLVRHGPLLVAPAIAHDLMAQLGVTSPQPPGID